MISEYRYLGDVYTLIPREEMGRYPILHSNIYTCIVGKNGTGKSRLLRSIVKDHLKNSWGDTGDIRSVISVSTSSFDKFPIYSGSKYSDSYTYLGIRDVNPRNVSSGYLNKISYEMFSGDERVGERISKLDGILDYLGFDNDFIFLFDSLFKQDVLHRLQVNGCSREYLEDYFSSGRTYVDVSFIDKLTSLPSEVKYDILDFIMNVRYGRRKKIVVESSVLKEPSIVGLYTNNSLVGQIDYIDANEHYVGDDRCLDFYIRETGLFHVDEYYLRVFFAVKIGLLILRNISFFQDGEVVDIQDASSGQQSVILSILGLVSNIKDGAIVLIDEPEVCLHPEWQERYIDILMNIFDEYKGCHFIIATHSPLVISQLKKDNCYIMSMKDKEARPASLFNRRSSDYQLANVFDHPGHKNEYVIRTLTKALLSIQKSEAISKDRMDEIQHIISIKEEFDSSDPALNMLNMVEDILGEGYDYRAC